MCLSHLFRRMTPHMLYRHFAFRNFRSDFDAFEEDTYVKHNLDYLRTNPRYEKTTYQHRNKQISALKENSSAIIYNQMLDRLGYGILNDNDRSKNFVDHLEIIDVRAVRSLNKLELQQLLYTLADSKNHKLSQSFIDMLDLECARRVIMWNVEASLLAFDLWIEWIGQIVTHKVFFNILLKEWKLLSDCRVPRHLVQLLFYIGLRKSSTPKLMTTIEEFLELCDITTLSDKEVVIICQGYFKTSTKLTSKKILSDVSRRVKSMLTRKIDGYAEYDLISMLKVLRHGQYRDDALVATLSECLKCHSSLPSNLTSLAHFMATFANSKVYDKQLFYKFEEMFLDAISVEVRDSPHRLKDTARILWALSILSHCTVDRQFDDKVVMHLEKQTRRSFKSKEKLNFIDCLHSLAVFGIFPQHLLQTAFSFDLRSDKIAIKKKPLRQLHFLDESLKIEVPNYEGSVLNLCSEEDTIFYENLNSELRHRPQLNMIRLIVRYLCNGDDELFRCGYLLSHIQIAGIELKLNYDGRICNINRVSDMRCAIEVVDSTVCINATTEVDGMMGVKLRQLEKIGYSVVKISLEDIHHLEDVEPTQKVTWMRCYLSRLLRLPTVTV